MDVVVFTTSFGWYLCWLLKYPTDIINNWEFTQVIY